MPTAKKSSSTPGDGFNQVETAAAKKKLKYAKILRQFLFQLMPDKTICRTRHSNVFTALYIKIDHFI